VAPYNPGFVISPFYLLTMKSSAGYYLKPGSFELLRVTGPDSTRFLQGQLTCDVDALEPWSCTPGAVCTNKGRVIAIFTLCRLADQFVLVMANGLAGILQKHLDRYRPFYKCSLALEMGTLTPLCFTSLSGDTLSLPAGNAIARVDKGWVCNMPGTTARMMHCGDGSGISAWLGKVLEGLPPALPARWQADDLLSGIFPFTAADTETYTPQEIHLDRRNFISFSKGCYTGQEIVARMHYKSRPKKQMYLLSLDRMTKQDLLSGFRIFSAGGDEIGTTIKQEPTADGGLLAIAQLPIYPEEEPPALVTYTGESLVVRVF
jgi:folate-binding protein YgfZ